MLAVDLLLGVLPVIGIVGMVERLVGEDGEPEYWAPFIERGSCWGRAWIGNTPVGDDSSSLPEVGYCQLSQPVVEPREGVPASEPIDERPDGADDQSRRGFVVPLVDVGEQSLPPSPPSESGRDSQHYHCTCPEDSARESERTGVKLC
jgi:hypothetical protein